MQGRYRQQNGIQNGTGSQIQYAAETEADCPRRMRDFVCRIKKR